MERKRMYGALTLMALAGFSCGTVRAGTVLAGVDYLATDPSSSFNFTTLTGGAVGVVNFEGLPVGPGNTDTIIQRLADATINGPAIPIQITELSLESTAPVDIGGSFFDVFIDLDPGNLANDTGTMSIMGTSSGGTFTSTLDVFFEAMFIDPANTALDFTVPGNAVLSPVGIATWSATQPASCSVTTEGDPANILHHNVCPATDVPLQDFYLTGTVPEPASIWLMGAGLLGLGTFMRRRHPMSR